MKIIQAVMLLLLIELAIRGWHTLTPNEQAYGFFGFVAFLVIMNAIGGIK